jgi:hypothetical protein
MRAWLAGIALCVPLAGHAAYKCVDERGQITYTDAPCPAGKASAKIAGLPYQSQPERSAQQTARLDFGRSPDVRLNNVVALLDSMALDGRNCEAALKADDRRIAPCQPFATVMQPGREWAQALLELHTLLQEPGFFERRRAEFARASALIDRISGHSQFMERRLGVLQ